MGFHLEGVITRGQSPGDWREGRGSSSKGMGEQGISARDVGGKPRGFGVLNPNEGSGWMRKG